MSLLFPIESQQLIKLALQLHNELGRGFKEKIYQDAFEVLLKENCIPFEREKNISLIYHGIRLQHDFYYDFLCWDKIGVEIKALPEIIGEHESQIINYLHVSNHELGVIFNFGADSMQYKWVPNSWHIRPVQNIYDSNRNK